MEDCIFCKIVAGEIPATKVHEDGDALAFLDIHPVNEGHTLVIPKAHVPEFQNIEEDAYDAVMRTARKIAAALRAATDAKRVGLAVVGFDVPHAHIHVVPLHDRHDLTSQKMLDGTLGNPTPEERAATAERIRTHL